MSDDTFAITSKMGNFEFDKKVLISTAKDIRDLILGQFFAPKPDGTRIRNEDDAKAYVRSVNREFAEVPFSLSFKKHYAEKVVRPSHPDDFVQ